MLPMRGYHAPSDIRRVTTPVAGGLPSRRGLCFCLVLRTPACAGVLARRYFCLSYAYLIAVALLTRICACVLVESNGHRATQHAHKATLVFAVEGACHAQAHSSAQALLRWHARPCPQARGHVRAGACMCIAAITQTGLMRIVANGCAVLLPTGACLNSALVFKGS